MLNQYTCIRCGAAFARPASSNPKTTNTHCSRSCAVKTAKLASTASIQGRMQTKPLITRRCIGCQQSFTVEYQSSPNRYCSHTCFTNSNTGANHRLHKDKLQLICELCGSAFQEHPYRSERKYCSPSCYSQAQRTGKRGPTEPVNCPVCGIEFLTWPYRLRETTAVTCSQPCSNILRERGEHRDCEYCGGPFYAVQQQIDRGQGCFCSIPCRSAGTRDETRADRNSWRYRQWRSQIYARDNYTCQRCQQRGETLHAHHIKMWSRYPELRFDLTNGITLCEWCHYTTHAEERTLYF